MDNFSHTPIKKGDNFQRIGVIPGVARRRRWSPEDKAGIVAESEAPGANVSAVARRYGINPSQLFLWRRALRQAASTGTSTEPRFVPVVACDSGPRPGLGAGIEILLGGIIVRVSPSVESCLLQRVLEVVRGLA